MSHRFSLEYFANRSRLLGLRQCQITWAGFELRLSLNFMP